jgi:hypothetical protein
MPIAVIPANNPGVSGLPFASMTVAPAGASRFTPTAAMRPSRSSTLAPDNFPALASV